jgi:hypothetical protein
MSIDITRVIQQYDREFTLIRKKGLEPLKAAVEKIRQAAEIQNRVLEGALQTNALLEHKVAELVARVEALESKSVKKNPTSKSPKQG